MRFRRTASGPVTKPLDPVAQASAPASSRTVPARESQSRGSRPEESGSGTLPELAAGTAALPRPAPLSLAPRNAIGPLCIALLSNCAGLPSVAAANSAAKPNVLFIAVDDLNDWIGCRFTIRLIEVMARLQAFANSGVEAA